MKYIIINLLTFLSIISYAQTNVTQVNVNNYGTLIENNGDTMLDDVISKEINRLTEEIDKHYTNRTEPVNQHDWNAEFIAIILLLISIIVGIPMAVILLCEGESIWGIIVGIITFLFIYEGCNLIG